VVRGEKAKGGKNVKGRMAANLGTLRKGRIICRWKSRRTWGGKAGGGKMGSETKAMLWPYFRLGLKVRSQKKQWGCANSGNKGP